MSEPIDTVAWRKLVDDLAPDDFPVMQITRYEVLAMIGEIQTLRAFLWDTGQVEAFEAFRKLE